ncbi:hypothetical protein GQ42DRAFT_170252 [Ramicandelaber brevisporus]|nr:hypothetical protein GQ42DRAFT_170252 [Ramicandelaber brevisporus]
MLSSTKTAAREAVLPMVPVSVGELVDKLTILDIKIKRIKHADRVANCRIEHKLLSDILDALALDVEPYRSELLEVNTALWELEDKIRECDAKADFGPQFIEVARNIYITNDKRSSIKKALNVAVQSHIVEEKSY